MTMKKILIISFLVLSSISSFGQIVDIPDINFKNSLLDQFHVIDTNNDGEIQVSEAEASTIISVSGQEISDLTGIASFTNLEILDATNNFIETVDLSQNLQLNDLRLSFNPLSTVDIFNHANLERLSLANTEIATINIYNNFLLKRLDLSSTPLTNIDLISNSQLELLALSNTLLPTIDLTVLPALKNFSTGGADSTISELDLSGNPLLEVLEFRGTPISSLDLQANANLIIVDVGFNQIESLDLSNNTNIGSLIISGNPINSIDVSNLEDLRFFSFNFSEIETIDLSSNGMLCSVTGTGTESLTYVNLQNGNNERFADDEFCEVSAFALSGGSDPIVSFSGSDNIQSICVDNIAFAEENFMGIASTVQFTENCNLSTEDLSKPQLSVYPNPTTDVINISQPIKEATIYDLSGRLIYKGNESTISLLGLNDGLYILRIEIGDVLITKKIIKRS